MILGSYHEIKSNKRGHSISYLEIITGKTDILQNLIFAINYHNILVKKSIKNWGNYTKMS